MYRSKFIDNKKNALLDGAETAVYIKQLYEKLYKEEIPVEVFTDNQSLLDPLKCSRYVGQKRLQINIAAFKDYINKYINNIKWIKLLEQLADILTKGSANSLSLIKILSNSYLKLVLNHNNGQGLEVSLLL